MFSSSAGGSYSTSCSFICTSSQTASRPHQQSSSSSSFQFGSNVNVAIEVTTTSPEEIKNRNYKIKCMKIQKQIREIVFINGSLQSELTECYERLDRTIQERRFLLNKVLSFQKDACQDGNNRILHQALSKKQNSRSSSTNTLSPSQRSLSPSTSTTNQSQQILPSSNKRRKLSDSQIMSKTSKVHASSSNETNTKRLFQSISLDSNGKPIFPIVIGGLTVHSIGQIVFDRINYHCQEYIYPIGFCSSRTYASLKNPKIKCLYTCKITENGDSPTFEIVPEDDPNTVLVGNSADECLHQVLSAVCPELLVSTIISPGRMGAAFFGYSHPTIQNLIQSLPGAKKCISYKWIKFEVSKSPNLKDDFNENSNAILNFDALQAKLK